MVVLQGGPALSAFRVDKLLRAAQAAAPAVRSLAADWVHFVDVARPLTAGEHDTLVALLTYGPDPVRTGGGSGAATAVVVPRPGTISPWSSKATDIVRNAGLDAVARVERGAVWTFETRGGGALDAAERAALWPLIHDRMVEAVLDRVDQGSVLFERQEPPRLGVVPVLAGGEAALREADRALGLALSDDEIAYLVEAFGRLERDPTDVELMMFAQANSEHCRHKIFNASWTLDGKPQERSLFGMIRNTHEVSPGRVLSAYKDNAAVVRGPVADRWLVDPDTGRYGYRREPVHLLMKVETHNHPTAISPDPGAGTGNGGEIRDEGATGRGAKPKAGLCGFHVSHLRIPGFEQPWELTPGKPARIASPLEIMVHGPLGGAAYNNEFGRPGLTGTFRTFELEVAGADGPQWRGYHKPIMIAGGVGNVRDGHVTKRGIEPGDALVVLGGPAMLIGLGGGAASSMGQGASSEALDFASVQRANPELQRRCQEVIDRCVAMGERNPIASIHDVGAGGLSNALPELVHDAGRGAEIALRAVPSAEPGLSPMALWCNEAQERYVLAIRPAELASFEAICTRERAPFAVVGRATADARLRVDDALLGDRPIDLPMDVLFGKPPRMHRTGEHRPVARSPFRTVGLDLQEAATRVLRFPAVAAKQFLITIGDRSITGLVARDQLVGPWQVPVADVAVTASGYTVLTGEAMAMGERTPLALLDAAASARMAVGEALTNLAAARVAALGDVVLSANWMASAGDPVEDAALFDAVRAVGMELCPALGICVPVGKDSLSMRTVWSTEGRTTRVSAPVSLIASAFAPVVDVRGTLTPQLRTDQGETALVAIDLGFGRNRLGGSALAQVYGQLGAEAPDLDDPKRLVGFWHALQELAAAGAVLAYHDRSDGGWFAAACEMAFAGHVGLELSLDGLGDDPVAALFAEELGALVQVRVDELDAVLGTLRGHGLAAGAFVVGSVGGDRIRFTARGETLVEGGRVAWQRTWWETTYRIQALRDEPGCAREEFDAILDEADPGLSPVLTFDLDERPAAALRGRPKVAILREQGVNGQMEMAAAFERAGFDPIDVHMSDVVAGRDDLGAYAGLVACGGFSYGDVLGAGGGWARTALFQPRARDAFSAFFARPDTFSLGVCNGCQMMALLVDLIPGADHWPRFVRNRSEQFEGRVCTVEVLPSPSLFFSGMVGSRLPVAVAHGEGRALFASGDEDALWASGLASARFVDHRGQPTETYPLNPNGSPRGLTGLTTRDGRVTLLMPHPERVFRTVANSWTPDGWGEDGPWMRLFRNARSAVG